MYCTVCAEQRVVKQFFLINFAHSKDMIVLVTIPVLVLVQVLVLSLLQPFLHSCCHLQTIFMAAQ